MLVKSIPSIQQHSDDWLLENCIMSNNKCPFAAYTQVFEGIDTNNQQPIFVKCMSCKDINMEEFERMVNATPISFPFILNLQHVFLCKQSENLYLMFDKCKNLLDSYIATKKVLSESEALEIFCQIVEGCIWLWGNNITHCNINPGCIFYRFDEKLYKNVFIISDFGVSTFQSSPFVINSSTSSYTAPEILMDGKHDCLSDVWSLGLILHRLFFGEDYYSCTNAETIKNKIKSTKYQLTTDQKKIISVQSIVLLEKMVNHDPKQRITKEQLQKAVREFHEYDLVRKVLLNFRHQKQFFNYDQSSKDVALQYAKKLMDNAWDMILNGYYKISKDMNKEALKIYQKLLGEDSDEAKHAMIRYAQDLMLLGQIQKAKIIGEKALDLYEKNKNEKDSNLARAFMIIGNIYKELEDFKTSKKLLEKAVRMRLKLNGEYHRDTAASIGSLGCTFDELGDLISTKQIFEKSLSININLFSRNHFETSLSYYNLSIVCYKLKDYKKALRYCQQAKKIGKKHFGKNHERSKETEMHELTILHSIKMKNFVTSI